MYLEELESDPQTVYLRMPDGRIVRGAIEQKFHRKMMLYFYFEQFSEDDFSAEVQLNMRELQLDFIEAIEYTIRQLEYYYGPFAEDHEDLYTTQAFWWMRSREVLLKDEFNKQPQGSA